MPMETVERAFFVTSGNAREYRQMADLFTLISAREPAPDFASPVQNDQSATVGLRP